MPPLLWNLAAQYSLMSDMQEASQTGSEQNNVAGNLGEKRNQSSVPGARGHHSQGLLAKPPPAHSCSTYASRA